MQEIASTKLNPMITVTLRCTITVAANSMHFIPTHSLTHTADTATPCHEKILADGRRATERICGARVALKRAAML